jgi:transposase
MFRIPRVSISMRELDRLIKQKAVAERLGMTVRQVRRLVERYELEGPRGLISKLRDRPGNRRLKPERAEEAFAIIRAQYADFRPTLAAEKLRERHGIDLAVGAPQCTALKRAR